MAPIPRPAHRSKTAWESLPTIAQFKDLIRDHLTAHLVLARRASVIDGCRIVFVTPRLPQNAPAQSAALANFIRTTLRPLTVTGGQEGGRLIHKPIFNQIDSMTGIERFVEAVLLVSLPPAARAPGASVAKALSGSTITV